ncbi:unnamed protein product [Pedinophyceae sp. YPF-701]|nr:unnamed protein product [Pedinophyceae sp. YPF-701]
MPLTLSGSQIHVYDYNSDDDSEDMSLTSSIEVVDDSDWQLWATCVHGAGAIATQRPNAPRT